MIERAERNGAIFPLVAPSPEQLRAGAVWVTISNWADALSHRYGAAEVITPTVALGPIEARSVAFHKREPGSRDLVEVSATRTERPSPVASASVMMRTGAKDLRWAVWAQQARHRVGKLNMDGYRGSPYVWQHHDLFQRSGFTMAGLLDVPLVLFVDAPQVWEARRWGVKRPGWGSALERIGERPQFQRADLVACVSSEVAEEVDRLSSGRAKTLVTPCTSPVPEINKREEIRALYGLDERLVIAWVGSFRRFHHADKLVRAVKNVAVQRKDIVLLMVGDGPTRAECEQLAIDLELEVRFTGSVQNGEVPGLLQACDIGVVPSSALDSFHYSPLKLKEYLAAGLATVVPRAGEMARLFVDGSETLMYQPGDLGAMTDQLSKLVEDPALRRSIATAGLRRLNESFSMADQLVAVEAELGIG